MGVEGTEILRFQMSLELATVKYKALRMDPTLVVRVERAWNEVRGENHPSR